MAPKLRLVPPTEEQRHVMIALPMVEQLAGEVASRFRPRVTREEMLGPGTIGAYEAASRYREEKHPSFPVYARHRIRGRMLDAIRIEHTALRARVERAMEQAFEEFAAHQVVSGERSEDPAKVIAGAQEGGDDGVAAAFFASVVEAQGASPEEAMAELEGQAITLERLVEALGTLLPLELEVMRLVYQQGMKLDDVADAILVGANTAQRRHVSALRKLRAYLEACGVTGPALLGA